jgi:hypothetical protein
MDRIFKLKAIGNNIEAFSKSDADVYDGSERNGREPIAIARHVTFPFH